MRTEASNQLTVAHMGVRDYIDGEFSSILSDNAVLSRAYSASV